MVDGTHEEEFALTRVGVVGDRVEQGGRLVACKQQAGDGAEDPVAVHVPP